MASPSLDALTPYLFTARQNMPHLQLDAIAEIGPQPLATLFVDDPATRDFGLLMNHTNQLAFGGGKNMGMPLWVLLDCGLLSSAVLGFGLPREALDDAQAEALGVPAGYSGLVPISEYCACPTLEPGCVSGFSLQSQLPGLGLGLRTKALAMLAYGATHQVGVTQFDNPSIRVHARLGPLQITIHRPSVHTHADNSFVYRVTLPSPEALARAARGLPFTPGAPAPDGELWAFNPAEAAHHEKLSQYLRENRIITIAAPGWRAVEGGGCRLDLLIT